MVKKGKSKNFEAASGIVPSSVIWGVIKKNNSFLVKRDSGRTLFSGERGNLRNEHNIQQSGLANLRAVNLCPSRRKDGKGAAMINFKIRSGRRAPAKALSFTMLGRDMKRDFRRIAAGIKTQVAGYRPDLTFDALSRWSNIHQSLLKKKKKGPSSRAARRQRARAAKKASK